MELRRKVTEVRISRVGESRRKAFARVTRDFDFAVRGVRVIERSGVCGDSVPTRRRFDGTYPDHRHPENAVMRRKSEKAVIDAYQSKLGQAVPVDIPLRETSEALV